MQMIVTIKNGLDVAWNGEATSSFEVIPLKGDASKFGTCPILSDGVVLLEDIAEVVSVAFTNVLDTKIINY